MNGLKKNPNDKVGGCGQSWYSCHGERKVTEEGKHDSATPSLAEEMELPHDLDSPFQVQALLDDFAEHMFSFVLALVQYQCVADVVRVFHTRQLWDARGTHL